MEGHPYGYNIPISEKTKEVPWEEKVRIYEEVKSDFRFKDFLFGCLNCGACTASCPSNRFFDYSPREIVQRFMEEDIEVIYDMMHEYIWACSQCFTCWIRCPFVNNPGGLVIIMREVAVRNAFEATKDLLKPYGRVLLKVMTSGNQLSADMLQPDFFPDWGPKMQDNMENLRAKRMAIPFDVGKSVKTAWEVSLETAIEMYTIWREAGIFEMLEKIDPNLYNVIMDIVEENEERWEELLEEEEEE
ncbi:MAG TPA: 4Fe-4S dicluster domain-containing protein [Aquifex aeolicus]|uniref:4Fe-4S dicluster domain-containing protein n=1 Tax=Aquifex aeolicus TaxID=63363 RepID=A0A7C5Q9R3_AQUAO|nr:4Fe-4S dicluster domain-containing protein [Aquifex aeolicus]